MNRECPYCEKNESKSVERRLVIRAGHFRRKSDCRRIQRFKCVVCRKHFSVATFNLCYRQKKRQINPKVFQELTSGVSLRRAAKKLRVNRKTIARRLEFLGQLAHAELQSTNHEHPPASIIEFDDMETFEHTKCKPLSITLAVEHRTRRILGFEVSRMPAKGLLARIARKKYGSRRDERPAAREELFTRIQPLVAPAAVIKSDQNPHYVEDVKRHFPLANHERFKGQRGAIVGQGELKKIRFDPLFSLNHTCAMLRANINRLFRKTWCTTKLPRNLALHIAIYAIYHNKQLKIA